MAAGVLLAASLPPFGWWPLGIAGAAVLVTLLRGASAGRRLVGGAVAGSGLYGISLWWITDFSVPGYIATVVIESAIFAAAIVLVPSGRGRYLAFPAALVLAEVVRGHWPFGGLPLAGLDLGQVGGLLAPAARLGGHLLLVALVGIAGVALAAAAEIVARPVRVRTVWRTPEPGGVRARIVIAQGFRPLSTAAVLAAALVIVAAAVVGGRFAPQGAAGSSLSVVAVQGGGPRGLRAIEVDSATVLEAHIAAASKTQGGADLVVLPENVVDADGPLEGSGLDTVMSDLARRLNATVVAGVVEDEPGRRFRNAAVVWSPIGSRVDRYEKVHRVPFGEYVPFRAFVSRLADLSAVPRDAIAGKGPGLLLSPVGPLGVVISYEVFFADRARAAVQAGGQILLVPTNASSYKTSQVPAQELAAARLRAIETARFVVQAAPTGYSAVVNPDGEVVASSRLGEPAVVTQQVFLQTGRTPAVALGDGAPTLLALLTMVAAWTIRKLERICHKLVASFRPDG